MYIGSYEIDDTCTFYANSHTPSTGGVVDADAAPGYRVYEDETGTPILTGSMALLDDANTVGFYSEQITLSAANGFEHGKSYCIRITEVVGGVTGVTLRTLQIGAKVDVRRVGGDTQSATDLKDFADDGYDPATNKVQGVVLVDTVSAITGIPAAIFSGITSLAQWLGLIAGKQVGDATARTELRATGAGSGTYDETTDSQEAINDIKLPALVAGRVPADMTAISGDSVAADRFETMLDGTGGNTLSLGKLAIVGTGIVLDVQGGSFNTPAAKILSVGSGISAGLWVQGSDNGYGILGFGAGAGQGILGAGGATGHGIHGLGGATSGDGFRGEAIDGDGMELIGAGSGVDLNADLPWTPAWDAEVQSEVTDALNAYDPPTRTEATADKDEILQNLPAAPPKNAAFTYPIKMVDASGDPVTLLTITMTRSLDGAAFGAATGVVTEISTGHYRVAASAADMNGDVVAHRFVGAGAKDLTVVFKTVS